MKYAIVVCATHNWLAPAAVTLLSCAKHGAADYADLLIVTPNPGLEQQAQLEKFNTKHATAIKLLAADTGDLAEVDASHFSIGTLLRLRLDKTFQGIKHMYSRILYLDCDILANGPVKDLLEIDMEGNCLAATEDIVLLPWVDKNSVAHKQIIGMKESLPYFNAGVLLFDWENLLREEILPRAYGKMISGKKYPLPDQDVLNLSAVGKWKRLHPKWNVDKRTDDYLGIPSILRHFTGTIKPWTCWRFGFHKYRKFYRESLTGTDWEAFANQRQKSLKQTISLKFVSRRFSFRTIKRLKRHLDLA
jgi:lipopolysaccharide biosynthesis glycosyltransferase